jgi:TrmH family RNA methyltransferase
MISKSTIKYIQSLQHKKVRDEHNEFVAEGNKLVTELLREKNIICKRIYALQSWVDQLESFLSTELSSIIEIIEPFELEKIAAYSTPNQVIAIFEKKEMQFQFSTQSNHTLVLDHIQDPGNLGTIIRTADWFGIQNIVCSKNTVDIYNPKVVQSTMASLARVNVVYTDLTDWLSKQKSLPIYAAALEGTSLNQIQANNESILIIGNEANGISDDILKLATQKITIEKFGNAESLNAAIATAIILHQFVANK